MNRNQVKMEMMIDFTCWDLNAKCVCIKPRARRNDIARIHRKTRRKNKAILRKSVDEY